MSDTKTNPPGTNPGTTPDDAAAAGKGKKPMSAADAAKAVKRPIAGLVDSGKVDGEGKPVMVPGIVKHVAVRADEVLDFKDFGTHVVVVTNDGQKFSSAAE